MKELEPRVIKLLKDIYINANRTVDRLEDETLESFTNGANFDIQDAAARRLTIIGEAAAALLKKHQEFCDLHPEIQLQLARAMRNKLVHNYDGVDWITVWDTVKEHLPQLIDAIEPFLENKS